MNEMDSHLFRHTLCQEKDVRQWITQQRRAL